MLPREVRNFAAAHRFEADRLIAVEVLTPGGNWGSYPPHKHDEIRSGETELEEIYHYIVADRPAAPGLAYQHIYGTPDRPIDLLTTVATGDTVLVPHGWHGPAMAAPGYDLYYLNVMAGPGSAPGEPATTRPTPGSATRGRAGDRSTIAVRDADLRWEGRVGPAGRTMPSARARTLRSIDR